MGRCRQSKAGRGNCRTMQTVEKQVVLEENWQVLAVVFPPFAQRLENSVSRACWPGTPRCRSEFSTVPTASATAADYIDKRTGNQIWDPESAEPRSHLPIYRMTHTGPVPFPEMTRWDGERPLFAFLSFVAFSSFDRAEFILRREVEPSEEDKKWLHQIQGKWRWELRDPDNPPPGHPPRHPWPSVYNEVRVVEARNEFLGAGMAS